MDGYERHGTTLGRRVDKMPGNILFGHYWLFELMRLSINSFGINARCI